MGAVYVAEHEVLGRRAAVKVLLPEMVQSPEIVQRFFREAKITSQLQHPGIVQCFDFGTATDGSAYIVMELLDGESLGGRLRRVGALAPPDAIHVIRQVASAVGAAHRSGVVHRDLKPDNIFLVKDEDAPAGERVKVLDFGIAKLAGEHAPGSLKTRTGAVMGTPLYMSPEQFQGAGNADARSDVYALGCILYEMLCGAPPFVAQGFGDIVVMHLTKPPVSPRSIAPAVSPALEAVTLRCLAKEVEERYHSMGELVDALDAAAKGRVVASGPVYQR